MSLGLEPHIVKKWPKLRILYLALPTQQTHYIFKTSLKFFGKCYCDVIMYGFKNVIKHQFRNIDVFICLTLLKCLKKMLCLEHF